MPNHPEHEAEDPAVRAVESPWTQTFDEVLTDLEVDPARGLARSEIRKRRKLYGGNRLREARHRGPFSILLDQFKSVVLLVLLVAAALAFVAGELPEAIAVLAVVLINTLIGFTTEWRAMRSMEALRRMGERRVRVLREGRDRDLSIDKLVTGDLVFQEGGDVAPADLRLVEANNLLVDESALTGESVAVVKNTEPSDADAPLAERQGMLFRGTTITEGSGKGVVVATGMQTQLGRITEMVQQAEKQATPLQQRLDQLGSRLAWTVLAIAAVVALVGMAAGRSLQIMLETSIALGIAAVPEGLPIVATIALARGMWLMARRQVLINRLTSVETLGATRVIFTDKTGTLTENRMTLHRVVTPIGEHEFNSHKDNTPSDGGFAENSLARRAVEIGILCSNASITDLNQDGQADEEQGDPTEVAMLRAGLVLGITREELLHEMPEVREEAFSADTMMMATFHETDKAFDVAVKGAPQAVLEACVSQADDGGHKQHELSEEDRQSWIDRSEELAHEGLRVLAVADKRVEDIQTQPYQSLRFVGFVGLYDPPAEGVKESILACRRAGIRVVMVTGDQPATAEAIGRQVGLLADEETLAIHGSHLPEPEGLLPQDREEVLSTPIFARVSPEQKLQIIQIYQDAGEIVAMTGDGINDAPALKKADIGVAMGLRGTDAAREAADMVLKDDALHSIVAAVGQGRVIFANIRRAVMFMLCTNVAEILAVTIAAVVGLPLPLKPLQILFLNVVTDVFPTLALSVSKGDPGVMEHPPRKPGESLLTRGHWLAIGGWSALISVCVLAALELALSALQLDTLTAVTISFLTLAFAKLWFVFNLRDPHSSIWNNDVVRNGWIWGSIVLCALILVAAVYVPGLSRLLKTAPPGSAGWLCVLGMSLVPAVIGQPLLVYWKNASRLSSRISTD
ncbi:MAG: cation-transporting P-type ATPase [Pirellulales bacterium]|nr:cation-transporting P-type ATPase [Pirellulales bacterium]